MPPSSTTPTRSRLRAELSRHAVETARRLDDPAAVGYTLNARHRAPWGPENVEDRLAVADEIVELGERAGDRQLALQGRARRALDLLARLQDFLATFRVFASSV